jgi:hypothetical protein
MSASLLFNPSQASTEELESTFVGRHDLLQRIEGDLLRDRQERHVHHWQIVGPRGNGKSHLSELLARRMRSRHGWRIARLPEENYHITSLGEFFEKILLRAEPSILPAELSAIEDDLQLQARVIAHLKEIHKRTDRPLLVIVENFSETYSRMTPPSYSSRPQQASRVPHPSLPRHCTTSLRTLFSTTSRVSISRSLSVHAQTGRAIRRYSPILRALKIEWRLSIT